MRVFFIIIHLFVFGFVYAELPMHNPGERTRINPCGNAATAKKSKAALPSSFFDYQVAA
ncbi:hypothetical protein [Paracandidimonas soli]|uniref:hypothetical protein n=1 Tax=Paracandidimonas soli TaxID=1917182 RepID=UPI001404EB0C|nr:hypothetical protein [Paracandidimonas soli]